MRPMQRTQAQGRVQAHPHTTADQGFTTFINNKHKAHQHKQELQGVPKTKGKQKTQAIRKRNKE